MNFLVRIEHDVRDESVGCPSGTPFDDPVDNGMWCRFMSSAIPTRRRNVMPAECPLATDSVCRFPVTRPRCCRCPNIRPHRQHPADILNARRNSDSSRRSSRLLSGSHGSAPPTGAGGSQVGGSAATNTGGTAGSGGQIGTGGNTAGAGAGGPGSADMSSSGTAGIGDSGSGAAGAAGSATNAGAAGVGGIGGAGDSGEDIPLGVL
jgi:hypothetical protein